LGLSTAVVAGVVSFVFDADGETVAELPPVTEGERAGEPADLVSLSADLAGLELFGVSTDLLLLTGFADVFLVGVLVDVEEVVVDKADLHLFDESDEDVDDEVFTLSLSLSLSLSLELERGLDWALPDGLGESIPELAFGCCCLLSLSLLDDTDSFLVAVAVDAVVVVGVCCLKEDVEDVADEVVLSFCSLDGFELLEVLMGVPELEELDGLLLGSVLVLGVSSVSFRFLTAAASSLVAVVLEVDWLGFENLLGSNEPTESTRCLFRSCFL
jgi:hypothetical protein